MAITTYAELQTAIGNWMERTDLSSRLPEFIAMFEAALNRELRVRQQITSTTLSPSSGSATLPTDYLMWKRVTWAGSTKRELEYVDPSYFQSAYPDSPSDTPRFFTIEGSTLRIVPLDTTSLTFVYAQKVPSLATTDPNWFLTAHPDAYLFGSLAAAKTMTVGEDSRGAAIAEFAVVVNGIAAELNRLTFVQDGPAMIRPYGSTP